MKRWSKITLSSLDVNRELISLWLLEIRLADVHVNRRTWNCSHLKRATPPSLRSLDKGLSNHFNLWRIFPISFWLSLLRAVAALGSAEKCYFNFTSFFEYVTMINSFYEVRLQGIMVVVLFILDRIFVWWIKLPIIPCWRVVFFNDRPKETRKYLNSC